MIRRLHVVLGISGLSLFWGCNSVPTELTESQRAAVDAASTAMKDVATVLGGLTPTAILEDLLNADLETPDCPTFSSNVAGTTVTITLDYGTGCSPLIYPDTIVSGSISGTFAAAQRSIDLALDAFTMGDLSSDGTVSGSFAVNGATLTLTVAVDLTFGDGSSVVGDVDASLNVDTGLITVTSASLTVDDGQAAAFMIVFADVAMDFAGNGNLVPESGTATFEIPNDGPGPDTLTIVVEFTVQTPVDGTVMVSVEGSTPYSYTPGGV